MKMIKLICLICVIYTLLACGSDTAKLNPVPENLISKSDTLINFEGETVSKTAAGFTAMNNCKGQLNWAIVNDAGNKVIAQQAKNGSDCFNVLVLDNSFYKDFNLSVKMKAVVGEEDQGGGLVWRFIDNDNYYIARCNPLENNFRFYRVVNGSRKELKSIDCSIKAGEWFSMSITMNGNKISCSLNGMKMIETTDDKYPNAGKVGLWTKADAQSYFDDLSVKIIK